MIASVELFILVLLLGFLKQWRREREGREQGGGGKNTKDIKMELDECTVRLQRFQTK